MGRCRHLVNHNGIVAAALAHAPYLAAIETCGICADRKVIAGLESVAANEDLRLLEGGRRALRPFSSRQPSGSP